MPRKAIPILVRTPTAIPITAPTLPNAPPSWSNSPPTVLRIPPTIGARTSYNLVKRLVTT
ncbi:hypothetical protein AB924_08215 [Listeria monocytogenes]|nr:hypothetical protein [Listeria monocytogenes]EAG7074043.1 hypothetical protein [Listeria monocytogenes]MCR58690.1 hypothetical protein [Listeria monocytogenes]